MSATETGAGEENRMPLSEVKLIENVSSAEQQVVERPPGALTHDVPGARANASAHLLDPQALGDHLDRLFRAAWALCGSREDAEDLVQDTCTRVLARPRLVHGDDLGYLMTALRNTFFSGRRTARRRPRVSGEFEALDLPDPRSDAEPAAALQAREIFAAIAALPPNQRDALVAIDVAGLTYREAAAALRIGEATITTRLFRARRQVARWYSQA